MKIVDSTSDFLPAWSLGLCFALLNTLLLGKICTISQWGKVHAVFPEVHGTSLNLEKKSKLLVLRYRGSVKDVFNA